MSGIHLGFRQELVARTIPLLPRAVRLKVVPEKYAWSHRELQNVARAGAGEVRCLIAPANFAAQGYQWARAAELLPGVSSTCLEFTTTGLGFDFPSDVTVPKYVGQGSHLWARKQLKEITSHFTHVLVEASMPILGGAFGSDLVLEIRTLQDAGVKVGAISHGSDVRIPTRHTEIEEHSPFNSDLGTLTSTLQSKTTQNNAVLDALQITEFVSTPDLLTYRPNAVWLPTVPEFKRWSNIPPSRLGTRKPRVVHVPSRAALKGAEHIGKAMTALQDEELISYQEVSGVSHEQMPSHIGSADIVIDQVGMGMYGVASTEAMLAGRLTIAQVLRTTRDYIEKNTGLRLPIIEANPNTISDVVRHIAMHPEDYLHLSQEGKKFVETVHSPDAAAAALKRFLT